MKKQFLLLLVLCLSGYLFARHTPETLYVVAISQEIDTLATDSMLTIRYELHAQEDLELQSTLFEMLPEGWTFEGIVGTLPLSLDSGEVYVLEAKLSYPSNLPFYPQSLRLRQNYTSNDVSADALAEGKVYFTPYNTIEIWNITDYFLLKRDWLIDDGKAQTRIYVSKDSIPVSNLPNDFEAVEDWQNELQSVFAPGLAYSIPMRAIHPDSITAYSNNSNDTTGAHKDGCGLGWQRFQGTITGRIRGWFNRDDGLAGTLLPLKGLKIAIIDYDAPFNDKLGETVTDENGNFTIFINTCQSIPFEGNKLEVFMRVYAENQTFDIKGKTQMLLGSIEYENSPLVDWHYNNGNIANLPLGDFNLFNDTHRAVHLAGLSYEFVNATPNIPNMPNELTIRTYLNAVQGSSFFLPPFTNCPSTPNLSWVLNPTIYHGPNNVEDENTQYHEFRHFVMWVMQGHNWVDIPSGSFADHSYTQESNSRISWTEGWANAFMAICDAHYVYKDEECHFEGSLGHERKSNFIDIFISNGLLSEYYVMTTLFDLWDGPNNYAHLAALPTPYIAPTFKDDNTSGTHWSSGDDNMDYGFDRLCQALIGGDPAQGFCGQIQDIEGFFRAFTQNMSCEEKRNVTST